MTSLHIKDEELTHSHTILDLYHGFCPECSYQLIFIEASFFCPSCGFSEYDFDMENSECR
jgi:rubrerythrin